MHGCPPKHVEMGKMAPSLGSADNSSGRNNAQLSTGDDWWRSQMAWGRLRKDHVTANMKTRDSRFARFMQQINTPLQMASKINKHATFTLSYPKQN